MVERALQHLLRSESLTNRKSRAAGTNLQEAELSRGLASITLRPKPPEWLAVKTGARPLRKSGLQSQQAADEELLVSLARDGI